jgi:hypothetical protein
MTLRPGGTICNGVLCLVATKTLVSMLCLSLVKLWSSVSKCTTSGARVNLNSGGYCARVALQNCDRTTTCTAHSIQEARMYEIARLAQQTGIEPMQKAVEALGHNGALVSGMISFEVWWL